MAQHYIAILMKLQRKEIINTELSHVNVWLKANKLSLNVAKPNFMVFHTSNKIVNYPKLKINDNVIERVQSFNYLGLLVHYNITWSKHIEKVSLKIDSGSNRPLVF